MLVGSYYRCVTALFLAAIWSATIKMLDCIALFYKSFKSFDDVLQRVSAKGSSKRVTKVEEEHYIQRVLINLYIYTNPRTSCYLPKRLSSCFAGHMLCGG